MANELKYIHRIEFHAPLFFAGRNFGTKVEVNKIDGLSIGYDEKYGLFKISYNGKLATASDTSAFLWELVEDQPESPEIVNEHKTSDIGKFKTAQVSTPHGHVFEGPGKGKTK